MTQLLTIALAILGGSAGAAIVNAIANRGKNRAQVNSMNIEGDLKIGENWREYAAVMKKDLEGVKSELTLIHNKYLDLETKYNTLNAEHAVVLEERRNDQEKIAVLEGQVRDLQEELAKYKKSNDY